MSDEIPEALRSLKHFLSIQDLTTEALQGLIDFSIRRKTQFKRGELKPVLERKVLAMLFQKSSLRTRLGFEAAMVQLGGHAICLEDHQIGVSKRLIFWDTGQPQALINPILYDLSPETFELWDDCMSFPDLLVRVSRSKRCSVKFRDLDWNETVWHLEDALSELIQHECDHLDGILATQRAIDSRSIALRSQIIPGLSTL